MFVKLPGGSEHHVSFYITLIFHITKKTDNVENFSMVYHFIVILSLAVSVVWQRKWSYRYLDADRWLCGFPLHTFSLQPPPLAPSATYR